MNQVLPERFWDLDDSMTVVLFAGMGGGCDGLEDAGFPVHLANNHDHIAIAVHAARHPHTRHLQCDVHEVDPRKETRGRRVGRLHASPDCTHFSVAKGSKPVSKRRRSLAWVIPRWCGTVRPELVTLENVREIQTWGPLIAKRDKATGRVMRLDGSIAAKGERVPVEQQWLIPDPRHKGRIWRAWLKHMRGLGYSFEFRILCCADYGVPTIRTRLFGVGRADGGPIHWPERSHAPRDKAKALGLEPWVGAHTIIDWSLPMTSIFGRKKPLADATLRRIARGVMRYVVEAADPFIVPITHAGDFRVNDIRDPLRTQTTAHRGEHAVVVPSLVGLAHGEGQGSGHRDHGIDHPLRTIHAGGGNEAVVAAHLVRTDQASAAGLNGIHDPREPVNTLHTAGGMAVAAVSMIQTGYGEREGQAPRTKDIEEPAGTQVAGGGKEALVAAFLAQHNGDPRRDGGKIARHGRDVTEPLGAVTASAQIGIGAVYIAKHNTDVVGNDGREPLATLTTGGERGITQLAPVVATLRGTSKEHDVRDPVPTQSAGGGHEMLILPFLQTYYGSGENNHDARDPLHTVTVNDRHGLVTVEVNGQTMIITDICMRMLDPLEGARAHGFDPTSLQHEIEVTDKHRKTIRRRPTKTEIGHLVGNSVPRRMVQLLVEANCRRELMVAAE